MEVDEKLLHEIAGIFRQVEYGKIIFRINPENKSLDCTVETSRKLPLKCPQSAIEARGGFKKAIQA